MRLAGVAEAPCEEQRTGATVDSLRACGVEVQDDHVEQHRPSSARRVRRLARVKQRSAQGGSKSPETKLVNEHNHNVVMLLQSKLADTSMTFKDVLEIRTQVCLHPSMSCSLLTRLSS